MKKIFTIILSALLLTGCFSKLSTYEEITYKQLDKMFKSDQAFVLFIGSSACSHCQVYKPKLEAVIKVNQVKVYYIDISKLSVTENNKLEEYVTYGGTPYTTFIKNGKQQQVGKDKQTYNIEGDRDIDYIEKIFKINGYIK